MKRVLLFGAYANGNLGDAEQAASVARHIKAHDPSIEIVACSHSTADGEYFPAPAEMARNMTAIMDPDFVNSFDALVIGGGGLLASRHKPLTRPGWAESITIPVAILGVGASPEVAALCADILRKAVVVSVRDEFSHRAVTAFRDDAFIMRDPILADRSISRPHSSARSTADGQVCVIPRKLVSRAERSYAQLAGLMRPDDFVCTFFPATDEASGALAIFEAQKVRPAVSMRQFAAVADASALMVSDRYHGCILGLKSAIPTLPVFGHRPDESSKIFSLYRDLGIADRLYDADTPPASRDDLFRIAERALDMEDIAARLEGWSADFDALSRRVWQQLGL